MEPNVKRADKLPEQDSIAPTGNSSILNAFKEEFATAVYSIYINSLGREVKFKEVSASLQKSLSKTMLENTDRKDISYDAQCALINSVCLEPGFDIYDMTEFDRIRVLMELYKSNYYKNKITYKCKECGCDNQYDLNFQVYIDRMNQFDLRDVTYVVEDNFRVYNFTLNYPRVRAVSNFYKNYMKKYKYVSEKQREVLDNIGNMEYVNLYINKVELTSKATGKKQLADFSEMSYNDIEQLLALFPQSVIFSEQEGVIKYIAEQFIGKINTIFKYEKCLQCGAESDEGLGSLSDFF